MPTRNSLRNNQRWFLSFNWSRAIERMTSVNVWLPAIPPMLATIGINTAKATSFSMVVSNSPITHAAKNAVNRLIPSHTERRWILFLTGANVSSSSLKPAILSKECSASSRITSTTSSMVMRPSRWLSLSTTGAEIRSCFSKRWATSWSDILAGIGSTWCDIASRTVSERLRLTTCDKRSVPRYLSWWSTT